MIYRRIQEAEYLGMGDIVTHRWKDYRALDSTILGTLYDYWLTSKSESQFDEALDEALRSGRLERV